ncbi:MAG: UDP-N-acetylglucosamine 2-epimerase [Clostridium sp.]|nr:UDP-N-acetylglucosamine 2-epimerase [Clostridium sp.]
MIKAAVVTATRAEYGILNPLIKRLNNDSDIELKLIVTGTHLSEKYGYTINEIISDGYPINKKIPIHSDGNSSYDISVSMAKTLEAFAEYFRDDRADLVFILGDRTEMLAIACAALNERIPICHIHGGELSEGAVDDCIRHAITKMSYLHFASTEVYKNRIIQLGESPSRVFNFGALAAENILNIDAIEKDNLLSELELPENCKYAMVTFHPVTLECNTAEEQVDCLFEAMNSFEDLYFIVSKANSDAGGEIINKKIESYAVKNDHIKFVSSLGMKNYLNAVRYAEFVLGNSSSGIIEAPIIGTPTVNIGDRQKGRLMTETIINCGNKVSEIQGAIKTALNMEHKKSVLYGSGNTSEQILSVIKETFKENVDLKKNFYDIKNGGNHAGK